MRKDQMVLSIMAGITIGTIYKELGTEKIVRAMPNPSCSGWTRDDRFYDF
ncbi:MAG: hypothetical protein R3B93_13585 [Bacteroidia bacterium]